MYVSGWMLVSVKDDHIKELYSLQKYDDYTFGVQYLVADVADTDHELGILNDSLTAIGFKEEMRIDYDGERRWLYSVSSNESRIKELYSIVHAFHKMPLTMQGLGFESFDGKDGHVIFGRGGKGKMVADMLWNNMDATPDDKNKKIIKSISKSLNAKEKMMLQFSSPQVGNAIRQIDDIINQASPINKGK
jgi:hypothetical protein